MRSAKQQNTGHNTAHESSDLCASSDMPVTSSGRVVSTSGSPPERYEPHIDLVVRMQRDALRLYDRLAPGQAMSRLCQNEP